jgi:23S rRNA pseudouridine1911/1915/1917 synthase
MVEKSVPRGRLDTFLRDFVPGISRGAWQRLILEGNVLVNGQPVKPTHAPRLGEVIAIEWPSPKAALAQPEAIGLEVLFEDDHLLVLNKAPDIAVHPSAGHEQHTLVNALLHHCAGRLSGIGGVARPGIVHRLDLDTSGCLVVAKDDATHLSLAAQFAARTVQKTYLGIVCGVMDRDCGRVSAAIARHPTHRKRMAVTTGEGREALTTFAVVERWSQATMVEARLHTGRTHQIRVHFHHLGHPLVGDQLYGKRQNARLSEIIGYRAPRQMLHAWELTFLHPVLDQEVTFQAPWPADFREALRILRAA